MYAHDQPPLYAYYCAVQYKPTAKHGNADWLSRLPLDVTEQYDESEDVDVVCVQLKSNS